MGILMSVEFIGSLPESLTQGLLIGKLLIGGLGVLIVVPILLVLLLLSLLLWLLSTISSMIDTVNVQTIITSGMICIIAISIITIIIRYENIYAIIYIYIYMYMWLYRKNLRICRSCFHGDPRGYLRQDNPIYIYIYIVYIYIYIISPSACRTVCDND